MFSLEIKTVQGNAFKLLIEALKDILGDVNLTFNKTGIKLIAMDSSHTVLVYLKLESTKFEIYKIDREYSLGVNMLQFFKLIKTIGNNDTLTLFLDKGNQGELGIKIENSNKNSITTYRLKLLDLNEETINVPPTTFNSIITLPASDFQKICRDMNNLAELLEIKSTANQLIFTCKGDFCTQETVLGEASAGLTFVENDNKDDIIQGIFSLKHLVLFTKCTNLCPTIKMYIKNDYPIVIEYIVASLGIIKLCLAPKVED